MNAFMDGLEAYKNLAEWEETRKGLTHGTWAGFLAQWLPTGVHAENYGHVRDEWLETILSPELTNLGWHASASDIISSSVCSRRRTMQLTGVDIPADYREPNLWVLCPDAAFVEMLENQVNSQSWHHWQAGYAWDGLWDAKVVIERCYRLVRAKEVDDSDRAYFLTLKISSPHTGDFTTRVLFLNQNFWHAYDQWIKPASAHFSHAVWASGAVNQDITERHFGLHFYEPSYKWVFSAHIETELMEFRSCGGELPIGAENEPKAMFWKRIASVG